MMWKNIVVRQATDDNLGYAHYKRTVEICNTYCFSTSATLARTLLHVPLHVHFLFCCQLQLTAVSCLESQGSSLHWLVYTVISYFLKICSSVGIVTWPRTGRPRGRGSFRYRYKIFLFCTTSRPPLRPNQASLHLVSEALLPRIQQSGREADQSLPSDEIKSLWGVFFISAPPHSRLPDTEPN